MKKQIKNIESITFTNDIGELMTKFPSFKYEDKKVCPYCDNCMEENCLLPEPSFIGICSNYKFSEDKFNKV